MIKQIILDILRAIDNRLLDYADHGKGAAIRKRIKHLAEGESLQLSGVDLTGANLREVDLANAILAEANLADALLQRSDLRHTNLIGANLRRANLYKNNLSNANLERADLRGTDLRGANLRNANVEGAIFREGIVLEHFPEVSLQKNFQSEVQLWGAKYDKNTQWPDDFDPVEAGAIYDG